MLDYTNEAIAIKQKFAEEREALKYNFHSGNMTNKEYSDELEKNYQGERAELHDLERMF